MKVDNAGKNIKSPDLSGAPDAMRLMINLIYKPDAIDVLDAQLYMC